MGMQVRYRLKLEGTRNTADGKVSISRSWSVVIERCHRPVLRFAILEGLKEKKAKELRLEPGAELVYIKKMEMTG